MAPVPRRRVLHSACDDVRGVDHVDLDEVAPGVRLELVADVVAAEVEVVHGFECARERGGRRARLGVPWPSAFSASMYSATTFTRTPFGIGTSWLIARP